MRPVAQEHPMGCAVACVGSLLGVSYARALRRFQKPACAWTRGFYCREICAALGKEYTYAYYPKSVFAKRRASIPIGAIIFIARSKKRPFGHYLLKTPHGWMNPWKNEPTMTPVRAGFDRRLPGRAQWIIHEKKLA